MVSTNTMVGVASLSAVWWLKSYLFTSVCRLRSPFSGSGSLGSTDTSGDRRMPHYWPLGMKVLSPYLAFSATMQAVVGMPPYPLTRIEI